MNTHPLGDVRDASVNSSNAEPATFEELVPHVAPDPEAGLSSVDAFVLCALILAAVAAAAGVIGPAIEGVGNTISGLIP